MVIVAQYYAQKDYIAKNLCENRDKPMMHCDGKCCLKKKLAAEGKNQAPAPRNQKSEQVVNLFHSNNSFELRAYTTLVLRQAYLSYNDLHTATFHHSVFHPPTV